MTRKIVFLDFDGVLNSDTVIALKRPAVQTPNWPFGKREAFEPEMIERLNRITDATGAEIVVSSSWRIAYPKMTAIQYCEQPLIRKDTSSGLDVDLRCLDCPSCRRATTEILTEFLKARGLHANIIDITPIHLNGETGNPRGLEIKAWLDRYGHDVYSFVILDDTDDCDDAGFCQKMNFTPEELKQVKAKFTALGLDMTPEFESFGRSRLVLTAWTVGLQDEHVKAAIEVLMVPHKHGDMA